MNEKQFENLYNKLQLIHDIDMHCEKAMEKHPHFADVIDNNPVRSCNYLAEAMRYKKEISHYDKVAIHDILLSEVYEMLAELQSGNFERLYDEALDVIAVLIRACEWLEKRKKE